ncbi:3-hydroxyisobutyryl-CoA hydrolase-like protein 4, mitochondrial isoform X2 [Papaver somniferum]|uniref:3-hydroxyisobutyryl-CoA hydrolase-like protein 4, mitochondrial isoform X2 n=1 Tax=Papaver somniferum TaxID=3469 RepID=UPI000E6FC73A|nr:3-hydroxyisobutyryl-CoA hydrolase-like protein 4, mitochondrial isoform X2 [Papaver somniferum]
MGEDLVKGSVFPNGLAFLTLDRPKALNAMNLVIWRSGKMILRSSVFWSRVAHLVDFQQVITAEYSLICKISDCKVPYISFMDGIIMGFGIGLSGHGRCPVITEPKVDAWPRLEYGILIGYISTETFEKVSHCGEHGGGSV